MTEFKQRHAAAMKKVHELPGPWQDEPDRLEWRSRGFACLVVRNIMGAWCGYVGVPPGHPWFGVKDVDADVHGGVTFSGPCTESGHICHTPLPGEPEVFWQGFDCNHAYDIAPLMLEIQRGIPDLPPLPPGFRDHESYRGVAYAKAEVERLAEQAEKVRRLDPEIDPK